jgi:succinyl-CoA synthetase beta subunit
MKLHEYQAKELLARAGVPIPKGGVAYTVDEARAQATELGGSVVVKAQVHAGGRGKGGGVKLVTTPDEAAHVASALLGSQLVTPQTGPEGVPVGSVLIEETIDIACELYLAMLVDGGMGLPIVMVSEAGGMDIEKVAEETPEKILREPIDPALGLMPYQSRKLAAGLGLKGDTLKAFSKVVASLHRAFTDNDCSLAEINPLVITGDGSVIAADAKITIDDDALFRHRDLGEMYDPAQDLPIEVTAREHGMSYVKLDGDVGCLVNGAGLAMATMDVTVAAGAAPANFLDVGGGADEEKVAQAVTIIMSDPGVKRVLINIFGGILRCDVVARGVLLAAERSQTPVPPMAVRMLGTNAQEGRAILDASDLNVTLVDDFAGATAAIREMA